MSAREFCERIQPGRAQPDLTTFITYEQFRLASMRRYRATQLAIAMCLAAVLLYTDLNNAACMIKFVQQLDA